MEIELIEKRKKNSRTFLLDNGELKTEIGAVSFSEKNGLFIPTDTDLKIENGKDNDTDINYEVKNNSLANDYDITFGENNIGFVKMKYIPENKIITIDPLLSNKTAGYSLLKNKMVIVDLWEGIDIEIFITDYGFKSNYIIKSILGQRIISYQLDGDVRDIKFGVPFYIRQNVPVLVKTYQVGSVLSYDFTDVPVGVVVDPTTTFQPTTPNSFDTNIFQEYPTLNQYASETIGTTNGNNSTTAQRFLHRFDVSSISPPVTVSSCTYSIYEYGTDGTSTVRTITLNRLLRNWYVSQGANATWNNYDTGLPWTTGGASSDTNDYTSTVSASLAIDGVTDNAFQAYSGAQLNTDVQGFINGTIANHGWRVSLTCATINMYNNYRSGEYVGASQRPKLAVTYTEGLGGTARMMLGVGS